MKNAVDSTKLYRIVFILSLVGLLVFILDFGFEQGKILQASIDGYYFVVLVAGIGATFLRYFQRLKSIKFKVIVFDVLSLALLFSVIAVHFFSLGDQTHWFSLNKENWVKFAIFLTFIREFSELKLDFNRALLNPAQLFIASFLAIIFVGSLLLVLPNATYDGISFLDALFTSTSAVCVTGLAVVDTGSHFTLFGQSIIMLLIQIGGLGILTFASYFSYFFTGTTSYETQLVLSDITNAQKIGEVFSVLKKIILITFSIELVGALLIYYSLDNTLFNNFFDHVFFAAFHAVSAFCNAGFSTFSQSLYEESVRFNYALHLVVIALFVLGGLGFPIVINLLRYARYLLINRFLGFSNGQNQYKPWVLHLNSRINLITTFTLLIVGTMIFFITEFHHTLEGHSWFGKIVTALFGAATPRTAGFNTVDMSTLNLSTLMLVFLLMWIGASPASTGGGIKTSTFAIATLNFLSLARGKNRIEVYRREIAEISVKRAFAIMSLSLMVIGFGTFCLAIFDSEKPLLSIAFECFSAYSTVGLSLGVTGDLSPASRFVLIGIMFVGRVGMLSVLIAVFKKEKYNNYRYPSEEITIN
ncbi:MAG TPA: potassium transporter TrkG [Saprospiraceae bacterium]|nr:potassium transporter TrkG [Saprospiraceae bacterium]HMQ83060.1 potassium transporter TrkG [Saprospiraceae bacterium]